MKILLLLSLLPWASSMACRLNPSPLFSFSGPFTVILKEAGLLSDPSLKGISVFHPVSSKEFAGKRFPGGVFFSRGTVDELKGSRVYFDESSELRRIFVAVPEVRSTEVRTRGKIPQEVIEDLLKEVALVSVGCEGTLEKIRARSLSLEKELLRRIPEGKTVVFYLGKGHNGHLPEMLMVRDGIVKWLVERKKLATYPSELGYVNWSQRVMDTLPGSTIHVGLVDSGAQNTKNIAKKGKLSVVTFPGILTPGYSQLEGFLYLAQKLF